MDKFLYNVVGPTGAVIFLVGVLFLPFFFNYQSKQQMGPPEPTFEQNCEAAGGKAVTMYRREMECMSKDLFISIGGNK